MHRLLRTLILHLLLAIPAARGASTPDAAAPPQGYVLLKGANARLALAGNLFRIVVRDVIRSDGSKATAFRDVDYPVREVVAAEPAPTNTDAERGESTTDDGEEGSTAVDPSTPPAPAREFAAWVMLGPEYEDPPPANTSPSANRLRRPGPATVVYEFDGYAESGGSDDEALRIEMDFSGTHPVIRQGWWSMEAEAGEFAPSTDARWDFVCEQGAYGTAYGRIGTTNLHLGVPEMIAIILVRAPDEAFGTPGAADENLREGEGTGTYELKRKPAEPSAH